MIIKSASVIPIGDLPVCVYCKRGTTPTRFVRTWASFEGRALRYFHAHGACSRRSSPRPHFNNRTIPPEPLVNLKRLIPSLAESLNEWNRLADDLDRLTARLRSESHALATVNSSRRTCAALRWDKGMMSHALANPRFPDEADEQVRVLRWHVERLRAALERDPSLPGRQYVCRIEGPDLRLPETAAVPSESLKAASDEGPSDGVVVLLEGVTPDEEAGLEEDEDTNGDRARRRRRRPQLVTEPEAMSNEDMNRLFRQLMDTR